MLLPDDAKLVARDTTLAAGLSLVLDNDRLADACRARWPQLDLRAVRANYIRYKAATSCMIGFVAETGAGPVRIGYAKAYDPVNADKLTKRGADRDGVGVWLFPTDAALDTLGALATPESRLALAQRLLPDFDIQPDHPVDVESLAYKPERRFVARLTFGGTDPEGEHGGHSAVVKFYGRGRFARALLNAKSLRSRGAVRIPRRLGDSIDDLAIASKWIKGQALADRDALRTPPDEQCEHVGAALCDLHAQRPEGLAAWMTTTILDQLTAVTELIGAIAPQHAALAQSVLAQLAARLHEPSSPVTIHGDFYANQVVISRTRIGIVDLDEVARGDACADVGNFIAQWHCRLECAGVSDDAGHALVDAMRDALQRGYAANGGSELPVEGVTLYAAVGCLKLAARSFRRREPGWGDAVGRILARAQRLLDRLPTTSTAAVRREVVVRPPVIDPLGAMRDRSLIAYLGAATDPNRLLPELERLLGPAAPRELRGIRITRHKPDRRCLLEYDFDRMALIGKIRAKGVNEAAFALFESVHRAGFGDDSTDGVSVPQPVGIIRSMAMALQRKVPGVPSTQLLAGTSGPELARRMAAALVKLHRCGVVPTRHHTPTDELRILRERLTTAATYQPHLADAIESVYDDCQRLAEILAGDDADAAPCVIHRDFYPDQVLVDGRRLYLLDLDLCSLGHPALDAGNFIAHLTEQAIRQFDGDPSRLAACEQAFEDEFLAQHGESLRPAVRVYATLALARHIGISTLIPDRRRWTPTLVELCRDRLAAASASH